MFYTYKVKRYKSYKLLIESIFIACTCNISVVCTTLYSKMYCCCGGILKVSDDFINNSPSRVESTAFASCKIFNDVKRNGDATDVNSLTLSRAKQAGFC